MLIKPAAKLAVLILIELTDPAMIIFVLKRFVLTFAVVTPPAGENPPDKFNDVNVAVPAFTVFVLIFPEFEILAVFVVPRVVVPATPRVPVLEEFTKVAKPTTPRVPPIPTLPVNNELPLTPRVAVLTEPVLLILPVLLIFTEVRMLPKSSLPTKRFVT